MRLLYVCLNMQKLIRSGLHQDKFFCQVLICSGDIDIEINALGGQICLGLLEDLLEGTFKF